MKNKALNHSTWRLLLFALLILAGFTHAQADVYLIGDNVGWENSSGQMSTTDNTNYYLYNQQFNDGQNFRFNSQNSWQGTNYGAENNGWWFTTAMVGTGDGRTAVYANSSGENNFVWKGGNGKYNVCFNINDKKVTITPADLYFIGDPVAGGWNTGTQMNTTDHYVFTLSNVTLTNGNYYRFCSSGNSNSAYQITTNNDSHYWINNDMLNQTKPLKYFDGAPSANFYFNSTTGLYDIVVDLHQNWVKISPKIDFSNLYVLGAINSQSWHANEGTLMTKNGDNYTLTNVYLKNGAKFSFTTALGASADDWDSIKGSRIGSNATSGDNPAWWINSDMIGTAQNAMGTMGTHYDFYFNAESGYYDMEVNLVNGTIKISAPSYPIVYVFDSANPFLYAKQGDTELNGSGHGNNMGNFRQIGNVEWYTWTSTVASSASNPINITLRHINIEKTGISMTGNDLYFIWNEETKTYTQIDKAEAEKLRSITVSVRRDSDTEDAPSLRAVGTETSEIPFVGEFPYTNYSYGSVWWKKTLVVYETVNLTITGPSSKPYTANFNNVGEDVFYKYSNGTLVLLDHDDLYREGKNKGVTIHLAIKGMVTDPSTTDIYTWGVNTHQGEPNYGQTVEVPSVKSNDTFTTADGLTWMTWTVEPTIVSANFRVNGVDVKGGTQETDHSKIAIYRKSGIVWYIIESDGTIVDLTRQEEGYEVQTPDCAAMMGDHHYVYYTDVKHWGDDNVYCYLWRNDEADIPASHWPGVKMTKVGYDDGNPVYALDLTELGFTDSNLPDGIIFNDGITDDSSPDKRQTSDIVFADYACYDYLGSLYAGNTLAGLIQYGVLEGPEYRVFNDLLAIYFDPIENALYARDYNLFVNKSINNRHYDDNGVERLKVDLVATESNLMESRGGTYDQSNWVKIVGVNNEIKTKLSQLAPETVGGTTTFNIIPGETLDGQITRNGNPEFIAKEITKSGTATFNLNTYITCNFIDQYINPSAAGSLVPSKNFKWFFTAPKPNEVAYISWAVWDQESGKFWVPADDGRHDDKPSETGEHHNEWGLSGWLNVDWSLYNPGTDQNGHMPSFLNDDANNHQAFQFPAIIKLTSDLESAPSGAPRRVSGPATGNPLTPYTQTNGLTSSYTIFPISINPQTGIITAVNEAKTEKTVQSVTYYNLMGAQSKSAFDGVNIVITRYTDGTSTTTKVLK